MADESLRTTTPVTTTSGFAGHQTAPVMASTARAPSVDDRHPGDSVAVHGPASVAPELVRERVLAFTREGLGLGDGEEPPPQFAEVRHGEPPPAFLGRLLSAQNQLAARRAATWPAPRLRGCLDRALRDGCAEVLEMFQADGGQGDGAVRFVEQVLVEYERRLAGLHT